MYVLLKDKKEKNLYLRHVYIIYYLYENIYTCTESQINTPISAMQKWNFYCRNIFLSQKNNGERENVV
jgi:hypothetical protein